MRPASGVYIQVQNQDDIVPDGYYAVVVINCFSTPISYSATGLYGIGNQSGAVPGGCSSVALPYGSGTSVSVMITT
jgi:hypothetical protein